jgi:cation:H+ antiporter
VTRPALLLVLAVLGALPGLALGLSGSHLHAVAGMLVFGGGILASAFLISWAAELAQLEVSQALALVVVALLAVLPEYAVDLYFAWTAATDPSYASYALANMTGANRLLVGLGWPLIVFIHWLRRREREVRLHDADGGAVVFLGMATLYAFFIPLKGSLTLVDTVILVALFALYVRFAMNQAVGEPELVGPPALLERLPRGPRRAATLGLFAFAALGIYACAEPFAESLLAGGEALGISEFFLVQWLAPLASEAPEFLVAALFCWKGFPRAGLGTLVSSKVNQWTLLVGTIPLVYAIALLVAGKPVAAIPLDTRQFGEILLTAAQSYMGVAVLLNLRLSLTEAAWLAALFLSQLGLTIGLEEAAPRDVDTWLLREKYVFSTLYALVGSYFLVRALPRVRHLLRVAIRQGK